MRISDQELDRLLDEGESFRVERKESMLGSASQTIREAVCAFANDLPGSREPGIIFVGVRNDGQPSGLAISDKLLLQLSDIKSDGNIVPPPSILVEKRIMRGSEIAVVTVLPSDSPPVRYNGSIFVRIGPRRGLATQQDERALNEKRRHGNIPFDIQPVPGVGLSDLNLRFFEEEYLSHAFNSEVLEANDRNIEQRLTATKMISSDTNAAATILGIMVLAKSPRDYIDNFYIQFLRINGVELSDSVIDDEVIDGTVSEILRRLDDKLKAHIHTHVDITGSDRERRTPTYPLAALQQIARNAVMHRTYEATHAPIRITWFDDRIEMQSPGGPYGIVTSENFGQPGVTDYRNPNLAEAMKVLGYVQRFGVGISSARNLLKKSGHPEPEFIVDNNFIMVNIEGKKL